MKSYVINLDRSPDRLERLQAIFLNLGLEMKRVPAVDGEELDIETLERIEQQNIWPDSMTRGEIACFLSHGEAIRKICYGDDAFGIVFEDDVELSAAAKYFLSETSWIPQDADIIKLETHGKKIWLGVSKKSHENYNIARLKSTHIMAAAYIISKPAAARFLGIMEQMSAPFDHLIFNRKLPVFDQFIIYQLDPAIARQADLKSTLQHSRSIVDKNKKNKRTLPQTFKREIKRLLMRSKIGLWGLWVNLVSKESWKPIKFNSK